MMNINPVTVALRLECVDRNFRLKSELATICVALRLECVDRNTNTLSSISLLLGSHSVWSAWIEICCNVIMRLTLEVALRLECVDRNIPDKPICTKRQGRTPFGVRG